MANFFWRVTSTESWGAARLRPWELLFRKFFVAVGTLQQFLLIFMAKCHIAIIFLEVSCGTLIFISIFREAVFLHLARHVIGFDRTSALLFGLSHSRSFLEWAANTKSVCFNSPSVHVFNVFKPSFSSIVFFFLLKIKPLLQSFFLGQISGLFWMGFLLNFLVVSSLFNSAGLEATNSQRWRVRWANLHGRRSTERSHVAKSAATKVVVSTCWKAVATIRATMTLNAWFDERVDLQICSNRNRLDNRDSRGGV